jgi:acetoin utilization deacetylase AcuC-like enzyme
MLPRVYYNERHELHASSDMHPECPERITAIVEALEPLAEANSIDMKLFGDPIVRTDRIGNFSWTLDSGDTYATPFTGQILELTRQMIDRAVTDIAGGLRCGFVLSRPPGHHAGTDGPTGFCHENNAWYAVDGLLTAGKSRIAVYDWDVHHGDGTEALLRSALRGDEKEKYANVRFVSTHAYGPGIYPGTGAASKDDHVMNVPFDRGAGSNRYKTKFRERVLPYLKEWCPEVLIVSAGYDAHADDPMEYMKLDTRTYENLASELRELGCPILFLLEGGYNPEALAASVVSTLQPFLEVK